MNDQQFYEALKQHLGPDAPIPVFYQDDRAIHRAKTLALPCYMNFKLPKRVEDKGRR
jgi:hypothetical protein